MATYQLIAAYEVGAGGQSSITIGSGGTIPQTYTDLILKCSLRNNTGISYNTVKLSFNGSPSGSSYSFRTLYTIGTTTSSYGGSSGSEIVAGGSVSSGNTSSTFSNAEFYIPNYAGSTNKSVSCDSVTEANSSTNGNIFNNLTAGLFANTSPITSIVLTSDASSFVQYSTAYLYGVKNA